MRQKIINTLHALTVDRLREMGERLRISRDLLAELPPASTGLPPASLIDAIDHPSPVNEIAWADDPIEPEET